MRRAAARVDVPSATAILESGLAFRAIHPDGSSVATDMPIALGGDRACAESEWLLTAATGVVLRDRDRDARGSALVWTSRRSRCR